MSKPRPVVCICGGGNAAHVMAGLAAAHAPQAPEVRVLELYENQAQVWTDKMATGDFIVSRTYPDGKVEEIKAKPDFVTNDASKAVTGADVIIFCVPAFAHKVYFESIAPYVERKAVIIGLPGQPGFEFQFRHILKERADHCTILNYETLPWACRIAEFGRKVDLLGTKDAILGSRSGVTGITRCGEDPAQFLQTLLGPLPVLKPAHSYLEIILMTKAFAHPPLMYSKWAHWDGLPLSEKPLFYQGLSEEGASMLCAVSEEIVQTAHAISAARPEVTLDHVEHIEPWLIRNYRSTIQDATSLCTAMRSNTVYDGLLHPMTPSKESPGQFVPDFHHRYLSEDVPYGLAVVKGVAQIAGQATPTIDLVMTWAQGHLGREFIVGSELKGKDVGLTRAPQAFGLHSMDDLLAIS